MQMARACPKLNRVVARTLVCCC